MSENPAGQGLIEYLKQSCRQSNKLFIPDSPRQEAVAEALVEHYESEILLEAIDNFVKSRPGPFLVFDFAIESKKFIDRAKQEKISKDKVRQLIKETQERMLSE